MFVIVQGIDTFNSVPWLSGQIDDAQKKKIKIKSKNQENTNRSKTAFLWIEPFTPTYELPET